MNGSFQPHVHWSAEHLGLSCPSPHFLSRQKSATDPIHFTRRSQEPFLTTSLIPSPEFSVLPAHHILYLTSISLPISAFHSPLSFRRQLRCAGFSQWKTYNSQCNRDLSYQDKSAYVHVDSITLCSAAHFTALGNHFLVRYFCFSQGHSSSPMH